MAVLSSILSSNLKSPSISLKWSEMDELSKWLIEITSYGAYGDESDAQ